MTATVNGFAGDPKIKSEAESSRHILATWVQHPECGIEIMRRVSWFDHFDRTDQEVHRILAKHSSGEIDLRLVAAELKESPAFSGLDPFAHLLELCHEYANRVHLDRHCQKIVSARMQRQLVASLEAARKHATEGNCDSAFSALRADLDDIQRSALRESLLSDAMTVGDFVQQDHRVEFLIPGVMPAKQGGCMSARSKSLKTTIAVDANVSMGTQTPFLGFWPIPETVKCGILTAESGAATIAETFRRIAASKGIDARDIRDCIVSTRCPKLRDGHWIDEIRRFIDDRELRCLTIDPTYLAFSGMEQNTLLSTGEALAPITDIIADTGCTILFVHHNRKVTASPYGCPTLEEITGSGFAEWSRFWLLLNRRREWDDQAGRHWLWLVTGGSAGFGARKWLDVTEGKPTDLGGRVWDVSVLSASEGESIERDERAKQQEQRHQEQFEADRTAACRVLARNPGGLSKSAIGEQAGISTRRWPAVLAWMIEQGDLVPCEIVVSNHKRPIQGYKLSDSEAA